MKRPSKFSHAAAVSENGKNYCLPIDKHTLGHWENWYCRKSSAQKLYPNLSIILTPDFYAAFFCSRLSVCLSGNRNILGKISRKEGKNLDQKEGEERTTRLMWPPKDRKSSSLLERRKSVKKSYFFVRGLVRRRSAEKKKKFCSSRVWVKTEEEKSPLGVWARSLHKGRPKEKKEEKNGKGRKRKIFSPITYGSNWTLLLSQMERRLFFDL